MHVGNTSGKSKPMLYPSSMKKIRLCSKAAQAAPMWDPVELLTIYEATLITSNPKRHHLKFGTHYVQHTEGLPLDKLTIMYRALCRLSTYAGMHFHGTWNPNLGRSTTLLLNAKEKMHIEICQLGPYQNCIRLNPKARNPDVPVGIFRRL